jgi:hypothetical protein
MAESNSENEDEYFNQKSNYYSSIIERENNCTEEERAEAKKLKEKRHKNYKKIHKKKIRAENLELDMKIKRLLREKDIFEEEEKHKNKLLIILGLILMIASINFPKRYTF